MDEASRVVRQTQANQQSARRQWTRKFSTYLIFNDSFTIISLKSSTYHEWENSKAVRLHMFRFWCQLVDVASLTLPLNCIGQYPPFHYNTLLNPIKSKHLYVGTCSLSDIHLLITVGHVPLTIRLEYLIPCFRSS